MGCSNTKEASKRRIKIELTREELEWLKLQLGDGNGGSCRSRKMSLEKILEELERRRRSSKSSSSRRAAAAAVWRPSLDTIYEVPEDLDDIEIL
ncbi:hypothetical protein SAY87_029415 [Trapa incisa]|uniref:Uncharacterized protein n=1 Tax=Trapa incisa TaxID=236973 RepID=A0AAN7K7H6_9MYRT|nr:hypothetical protein SAY87_029415 [Trapa incisa]